jgi:hypothetical protein
MSEWWMWAALATYVTVLAYWIVSASKETAKRALPPPPASENAFAWERPTEDGRLEELKEQLSTERDKRERFFAMVAVMEKERDQWRDLFLKSSAEHANAQEMLEAMLMKAKGALDASQAAMEKNGVRVPEEVLKTRMLTLSDAYRQRNAERAKGVAGAAES